MSNDFINNIARLWKNWFLYERVDIVCCIFISFDGCVELFNKVAFENKAIATIEDQEKHTMMAIFKDMPDSSSTSIKVPWNFGKMFKNSKRIWQ